MTNQIPQKEIEDMKLVVDILADQIGPHLSDAIANGITKANQAQCAQFEGVEVKPIDHDLSYKKEIWSMVYAQMIRYGYDDAIRCADQALMAFEERFPQ